MPSTVDPPAGPAAGDRSDELQPQAPFRERLLARVITPDPGDPDEIRALCFATSPDAKRPRALGRGDLVVAGDSGVSFPASYWARWTRLSAVLLHLHVSGACRVDVYRSRADGSRVLVGSESVPEATALRFELDLPPFADGGWLWFDVTTDDAPVRIRDAAWYAPEPPSAEARLAAVITTRNRPDDCAAALLALGSDPLLVAALEAVIVVDQGEQPVTGAAGYPAAAEVLGERLRIVPQRNLGASGGFARGMHESLSATEAEQILLLDDGIAVEPDCVLRALAFSRFATRPVLVGGQMLAAESRRTVDVDYTAPSCCLIPRRAVEDLGLPLPLFAAWDDVEYVLRAARCGYPSVTLPGTAIWRMPGSEQDPAEWQTYFGQRNRLVVAAMYSHQRHPLRLLADTARSVLRCLLARQYSTACLQQMAIEDFLAGPEGLFELLPSAIAKARKVRADHDDDRAVFRRLAARAARNELRLLRRFPGLRKRYRCAHPGLTSPAAWRPVFELGGRA